MLARVWVFAGCAFLLIAPFACESPGSNTSRLVTESAPSPAISTPGSSPEALAITPATPITETGSGQMTDSGKKPGANGPGVDACKLLNATDVQTTQGEAFTETKLTGNSEGDLNTSQCFYGTPTFTKSVSLLVIGPSDPDKKNSAREKWARTFHSLDKDRSRERDNEKNAGENGKGEVEQERSPPKRVDGVGDEAFWLANRVGGGLYVLKSHHYIRVSVGGSDDEATKIKKAKALAKTALKRIQN